MSDSWRLSFTCTFGVVFSILVPAWSQSESYLKVGACDGTMSETRDSEVPRITIGKAKADATPNGSCSLEGPDFRLEKTPILDFHIRVSGDHPVAFNLLFGQAGIGYGSGLPYSYPESHVVNIVGTQMGVFSLGDLGAINDGTWHHVVFDLAFAIKNRLGLEPESVGPTSLGLIDQDGGLQLFAGGSPEPVPTSIELRDIVLRPREPNEHSANEFDFFVRSSAMGSASDSAGAYLVAGSIATRQPLQGVRVTVEGAQIQTVDEILGDFEGRKDFAIKVKVSNGVSKINASVVARGEKILARNELRLPPELGYLQTATIDIIPNSHNDLAWLDTQQATGEWRREKVIRPAIDLLEKYPDYRFGLENNVLLIDYLSNVPEQAKAVHKLLAEKRLAFGAMYTQPFQSIWAGEGLIHELYYGRKWLRENVGKDVDSVTAWGTDVPELALQFPQILAKSGVKYLMLGRFRPGIFDWYSPDGSKITVGSLGIYGQLSSYYFPYHPSNVALQMPQLLNNWEPFYETHHIPPEFPITDMTDYLPPTKQLIPLVHEWNSEAQQKYGARFKLKFATAEEFMDAVTRSPLTKFPELKGEWVDPWGYTVPGQHTLVAAGREAEWDLSSAEKFWTLKYIVSHGDEPYQRGTFDDAWMAHIYFDHGPGGYNGDITDSVFLTHQEKALIEGRALLSNAVHWLADRTTSLDPENLKLVVFNPLSWKRTGPTFVEIPMSPDQELQITDASGAIIPSQRVRQVHGGTVEYVVAATNIPSVGYSTFKAALTSRSKGDIPPEEFTNKRYENAFYRLEFVPGGLRSIYDKALNKELLKTDEFLGGEVFALDSVGCDSSSYTGFGEVAQPSWISIEKASHYSPRWSLLESGPVRIGWRMEQAFKDATVRVDVYAYHQTKRLEFDVSLLHWSGAIYREFRMAMPVDIPDGQVTYDVPYAAFEVGRDELRGPAFENWYSVPSDQIHPRFVQDWISTTDGDFGVMLSSQGTTWDYLDSREKKDRFTLLQPILLASRRSCHPQGNFYSPAGDYDYHFALTSFKGTWRDHFQFGSEVNAPFPAVVVKPRTSIPARMFSILPSIGIASQIQGSPLPSTLSLCQVSSPHFIVSDIKVADDKQGIIVRGYEISNQDSSLSLTFPWRIDKANKTNLIEDNLPEQLDVSGGIVHFTAGHRAVDAIRISSPSFP